MSRLTRDGTAEPVSRDQVLRHERGQGNIHLSCSADHVQDWQPYLVDPCSCYMCDHTSLQSCLWSLRIFPSLPGPRLTKFYRDASSALLQLVNQWLHFTYSRSHAFRYKRKNTNPTLVRTELTTSALYSRCAGYLLDHSGYSHLATQLNLENSFILTTRPSSRLLPKHFSNFPFHNGRMLRIKRKIYMSW